jgi:hypothetical protein
MCSSYPIEGHESDSRSSRRAKPALGVFDDDDLCWRTLGADGSRFFDLSKDDFKVAILLDGSDGTGPMYRSPVSPKLNVIVEFKEYHISGNASLDGSLLMVSAVTPRTCSFDYDLYFHMMDIL